MEVKLLTHTPEPERITVAAALLCYQKGTPQEAYEKAGSEKLKNRLFNELVKQGHGSVLEHANFTFGISGMSRSCSHQLVRHRMGAFNQQSQRYVHVGDYDYFVIPPSLDEEKFKDIVKQIVDYYNNEVKNLKDKGKSLEQSQEDARFIIPNAGKTNVIWTTNLRNLIHVSHYRLCNRSQWEIRKLMSLVKKEMQNKFPIIAQYLTPKCDFYLYCDEGQRTCGRALTKEKIASLIKKG
ncbi:MAG: FAD-dependent thymidylate synthase [Candidatus Firestonebacteria bacterium]